MSAGLVLGIAPHIGQARRDTVADKRYRALGQRIRQIRRAVGWDKRAFAQAIGISPGSLPNLESGYYRVDTDVLKKIASLFKADYNELAELAGYYDPPEGEPWVAPKDKEPWLKMLARESVEELQRLALYVAGREAELLNPRLRRQPNDDEPNADSR